MATMEIAEHMRGIRFIKTLQGVITIMPTTPKCTSTKAIAPASKGYLIQSLTNFASIEITSVFPALNA